MTMAKAIEKRVKLPRSIVVVLDNNLIQFLAYVNIGIAILLGEWFEWLITCFTTLFQSRKDTLPKKAVRADYPQLYLMAPPKHRLLNDNHERRLLLDCMEATVKVFDNVQLIKMVESDYKDDSLVSEDGQFTNFGLTKYWSTVDSAVAFNMHKCEEYLSRRGAQQSQQKRSQASGKAAKRAASPSLDDDMLQFFKGLKDRKRRQQREEDDLPHRRLPTPKQFH